MMRLNLKLTPNTTTVPYAHMYQLTGALHKWLGRNEFHDGISLYSFGRLQGAVAGENGLDFPRGANWWISFFDTGSSKKLIEGILKEPDVAYGMRVYEVQEQPPPHFAGPYRFLAETPVVARRVRDDGTREYLLWQDEEADEVLTRVLRKKLAEAGLNGVHGQVKVFFDRTYHKAKSKVLEIRQTRHKGSLCPVIVAGTPEAVRFAWLVGIGELTGSGFGAVG